VHACAAEFCTDVPHATQRVCLTLQSSAAQPKAHNSRPSALLHCTQKVHTQVHTWKFTSSTLNSCAPELLLGSQSGRLLAAITCALELAAVQAYRSLQQPQNAMYSVQQIIEKLTCKINVCCVHVCLSTAACDSQSNATSKHQYGSSTRQCNCNMIYTHTAGQLEANALVQAYRSLRQGQQCNMQTLVRQECNI
jgi:hypothetical protein